MKKSILLLLLIFNGFQLTVFPENRESERIAEQYINNFKDDAIKQMLMYHIPASITLAQGMLESAFGTSDLAKQANNHFGIKCHEEWGGPIFLKDDDQKNECFSEKNVQSKSQNRCFDCLSTIFHTRGT